MRQRSRQVFLAALGLVFTAACAGDTKIKDPAHGGITQEAGDHPSGTTDPTDERDNPGTAVYTPTVTDYTPGYFRDIFRILGAQQALDETAAAEQLQQEAYGRLQNTGELPNLSDEDEQTLRYLLTLTVRTMQATASNPQAARVIAVELLRRSLGLDPSLDALAEQGYEGLPRTEGGAVAMAEAAQWALRQAAQDFPALCSTAAYAIDPDENPDAYWDPGNAEIAWVEGYCEDDEWVGGYCEDDEWIEGQCYEQWIDTGCDGGTWVDRGYYEYYCYSYDDCRYIWRSYWVYESGSCDDGYYEEYCDSGYWEYGICYDGTYVPGYCDPGHYEYRYPGGTWVFSNYATAPIECEGVRPSQYAIGTSAIEILAAYAYESLDGEWKSAIDALLEQADLDGTDEATFSAISQIVDAIASGEALYQAE